MGLLKKAVMSAVLAKVVDAARKPENQRKAKEMLRQVQNRNATRTRRH